MASNSPWPVQLRSEESRIELLCAAVRKLQLEAGASSSSSLFELGVTRNKQTLTPSARNFANGFMQSGVIQDLERAGEHELRAATRRATRYRNFHGRISRGSYEFCLTNLILPEYPECIKQDLPIGLQTRSERINVLNSLIRQRRTENGVSPNLSDFWFGIAKNFDTLGPCAKRFVDGDIDITLLNNTATRNWNNHLEIAVLPSVKQPAVA